MGQEHRKNTVGLRPPWQPGESGNTNGRPKGSRDGLRAHVMRRLRKRPSRRVIDRLKTEGITLDDKTFAEALAAVLVEAGTQGDMGAIKLIMNQTEPPFPRQVQVSGDGSPCEGMEIDLSALSDRKLATLDRLMGKCGIGGSGDGSQTPA